MQDPKYSLNPVMTVGRQIREAYRAHARVSRAQAERRALDMLAAVRIRDPERVYHCYPHEVSGGMGQRVMIAMMLVGDPDILIADEPTSALDVTVQMQVLAILDDLVSERGLGLIFISHDLNLVASFCDRVLIMYAGQVVETCAAGELHRARHPYTRGLLAALPRIDGGTGLCRCCAVTQPGSTARPSTPAELRFTGARDRHDAPVADRPDRQHLRPFSSSRADGWHEPGRRIARRTTDPPQPAYVLPAFSRARLSRPVSRLSRAIAGL